MLNTHSDGVLYPFDLHHSYVFITRMKNESKLKVDILDHFESVKESARQHAQNVEHHVYTNHVITLTKLCLNFSS